MQQVSTGHHCEGSSHQPLCHHVGCARRADKHARIAPSSRAVDSIVHASAFAVCIRCVRSLPLSLYPLMRAPLLSDDAALNEQRKRASECCGCRAQTLGWLALLLLLSTAAFAGLFAWKMHESAKSAAAADATPKLTPQVKEWILSAMNRSADPCVDFNQFSCGNWQAANAVPADSKYAKTRAFENAGSVERRTVRHTQHAQMIYAASCSYGANVFHVRCLASPTAAR